MTQDPGYLWAMPARYLMRSLLQNHKAAAWASQLVSRSSNRMADGSGPTATAAMGLRSTAPCRWLLRKQTRPWIPRDSASCYFRAHSDCSDGSFMKHAALG